MRIAVDARPLCNPFNGIGRYTSALLENMAQIGHDWYLYSSGPIQSPLSSLPNIKLRVGRIQPASPLSLVYSQCVYRQWLKDDAPDIFWSPRHHLPVGLTRRIPQVITIHDLVWKRFPGTMPMGARLLERLLMPAAIKQSKKIICVSQFTASEIEEFWPDSIQKCQIVYSGTKASELDGPPLLTPIGTPYVLFVGTLEPRKNINRLIEAFGLLKKQACIGEKLVIVGAEGWGTADLERKISLMGMEQEVILKGRVSDVELEHLYRGARCLALPSLYEGFGLPLVEAMRHSLPLVISNAGALTEIAGDAGIICDPMSITNIAEALVYVLTNETQRERLSKNSYNRAERFSWKTAATDTLKIFEAAMQAD